MFKLRPLRNGVLLAMGLMATGEAPALTLSQPPAAAPETRVDYESLVADWKRSKALHKIVKLLSSDARVDRDQGKMALARLLTVRPEDADALELAGTVLMGEKKYADAEQSFRRALRSEPDRSGARGKLGTVLLLQGDRSEGEQQLKRTLQEDEHNALALRYLGWLEQQRGNPAAAAGYLEHLVGESAPAEPSELYLTLGQLYNDLHQYGQTLDLLKPYTRVPLRTPALQSAGMLAAEAAIQLEHTIEAQGVIKRLEAALATDDYRIAFLKAGLAKTLKRYGEAARLLEGVVASQPAVAVSARIQLAQVQLAAGQPAKAEEALRQAVAAAPMEQLAAAADYLNGFLIDENRLAEAVDSQRQLAESHPQQPLLAYGLAVLEARDGRPAAAVETLQALLDREPGFVSAYWLASRQAERAGEVERARKLVEQGLARAPKSPEGWVQAAGLTARGGDPAGGIEQLLQGLQELPDNPWLLLELSRLYQAGDDWAQANRYYRQLLRVQPNHVPALAGLAQNLLDADPGSDADRQQAVALARRAHELAEGDPLVADVYGWALLKVEGPTPALAQLEKAAEIAPEEGQIRYHLAMAYARQGREALARQQLEAALDLGVSDRLRRRIEDYLKP